MSCLPIPWRAGAVGLSRPLRSPSPTSSAVCATGSTQTLSNPLAQRPEPWRFEVEPGLELDLTRLVGDCVERAHLYAEGRDRFILELPRGRALIRDTHITVDAVRQRLTAGESIEAVVARYPILTPTVVALVATYARSHPALGRSRSSVSQLRDTCGGATAGRPA